MIDPFDMVAATSAVGPAPHSHMRRWIGTVLGSAAAVTVVVGLFAVFGGAFVYGRDFAGASLILTLAALAALWMARAVVDLVACLVDRMRSKARPESVKT